MFEFPGYRFTEQVFQSPKTTFLRGVREKDKKAVLVKTVNGAYPSVIDRANYKNEYEIGRSLKASCIIQSLALEMDRNHFCLVLEDFPGAPPEPGSFLKEYGLEGFLNIAIKVADFLGECHKAGIIHRNLKPHNILIDKASMDVRVTGFLLTSLRDDHLSEDRIDEFIGSLTYISPEQTGRLNRNVDHRSDFYSLGVTFYHLLTGSLPFTANDPMALVHCHIAMNPVPVSQRCDIPEALSAIVMKMLNKTPEDRYQNGFGLAEDLKICQKQLKAGTLKPFPLGTKDYSHELHVPHKFYGREQEMSTMLTALEKVCKGESRFIGITASSGMGKSEFANELHEPIARARGYFIGGKYDQGRQKAPFLGLVIAFQDLIRQILSESSKEVENWRERILKALGANAQVLIDVVPDLEMVIGKQPAVPVLGTAEAQNRFQMTLRNFVSVIAQKEHPLAIFMDDLQWAGETSLNLLHQLLVDEEIKYLFVIAAFRKDFLGPDSPLSRFLANLKNEGLADDPIELKPLDEFDVLSLLRDILGCEPTNAKSFAQLILERTGGKPFDISIFLKSLYHEGLLHFDVREGAWHWDSETIKTHRAAKSDVVDLMSERLLRLPADTQSVLKIAACIGHQFSLQLLATACQKSQAQTASDLKPAVVDELITPLGDAYRLLEVYDPSELDAVEGQLEITFKFQHNRVHQTAYALMDEDQSMETHLRVGQRLLKDGDVLEGDIFKVVNQLNYGRDFIEGRDEKVQLAGLNLKAGQKAKDSIAWSHAHEYFKIALHLLPDNALYEDYQLWLKIHMELAEAECFNQNLEEGERLLKILLDNADQKDRIKIYLERVLIFNNISRLKDAVRVGVEGLRLFGLEAPEDESELKFLAQKKLDSVRAWLNSHDPREILSLPPASDDTRGLMQLLMFLTPPAFNTNQDLFRLIAMLQIELTLENGNTSDAPHAFAVLGILLGGLDEHLKGYEMGQLALKLNKIYPDPVIKYKLDFIGCNMLNHWACPLKEDIPILESVYREALNHGDLVYANYAILVNYQHRWVLDEPLLKILNECEKQILFARRTKNVAVLESQQYFSHAILNLRGLTRKSDSLETEEFSEKICKRNLLNASYFTGVNVFKIVKMQVLYIRGHYKKAYEMAVQAEEMIRFSQNTLMMTVHYFFYPLTLAAIYKDASEEEKVRHMADMERHRELYRKWADNCPENFLHKYHMISGEIERLKGNKFEAARHFNEAVQGAAEQELPMNEGLAHELALRFYRKEGLSPYVEHHLKAALHCYNLWGATARAADLESRYSRFMGAVHSGGRGVGASEPRDVYSQALDMTTLMKSAQTISGEFRVNKLIEKLMRLVLENAGAQRGFLLQQREGRLFVQARGSVDTDGIELFEDSPMENFSDLSKSLIRFTFRTKADLVIDDVSKDKQFRGDAYLSGSGVKAVLCVPMMRQTELVGAVYLENHLAAGAFSGERVEMLRLLAPQIAISLENARYVSEMRELNDALQGEIVVRKKAEIALKKAQRIALSNAHKAAKAEFANSVLHNINNVLNSVGLSSEVIYNANKNSKIHQLARLSELINKNAGQLDDFFSKHPKGKLVPSYMKQLCQVLTHEHRTIEEESEDLSKNLSLMRDIIEKQQADAKGVMKAQTTDLLLLVEDALKIQNEGLVRHKIKVVKAFQTEDPVKADKTQVSHILINLVKNAIEAMGFAQERILTLKTHEEGKDICLSVCDTGQGIDRKDLRKMFSHGFTTKKDGHGFGLHYCAKAMKEMGGSIRVVSEGLGQGACFILRFQKDL